MQQFVQSVHIMCMPWVVGADTAQILFFLSLVQSFNFMSIWKNVHTSQKPEVTILLKEMINIV